MNQTNLRALNKGLHLTIAPVTRLRRPRLQMKHNVRSIDMKVKHLSKPSLSGKFEELYFDVQGDCEWFKFNPDEADEWVGVFGCGDRGNTFAVVSADNSFTIVVAEGKAYVIDNESRKLFFKFDDIFLQGGIQIPRKSQVLVFDPDSLYIFNRTELVWDYYFQNVDGIRALRADTDKISGEVYQYGINGKWISFEVPYL